MYTTTYLDAHMLYVSMKLYHLCGKKNPTHFSFEWVTIMNEVAGGYTLNWAKMLSDNLAKEIAKYKSTKSKGILPLFTCRHMLWIPFVSWIPVMSQFIFITPNYGRRMPNIYFIKSVTTL
jgi:hypothetical protein